MKTKIKAGSIFLNLEDKTIAIVYREKQKDYSFPKGGMETGETIKECAIRETEEETKRKCILLEEEPIYVEKYVTPSNDNVVLYYYIAKDGGKSYNTSEDTHLTLWIPFDEVYDKLSYDSLKNVWNNIKGKVSSYLEK